MECMYRYSEQLPWTEENKTKDRKLLETFKIELEANLPKVFPRVLSFWDVLEPELEKLVTQVHVGIEKNNK